MPQISSIPSWLIRLFNPPPLASMSTGQKIGRVALVAVSLVVLCTLSAMALAAGISLVQRAPGLLTPLFARNFSAAAKMGGIILLSISVNILCVWVLLQVRRLDRRLMDGAEKHGG